MTFRRIFFLVIVMLGSFIANGASEAEINEKHIQVAMRMIGSELLTCSGDAKSRVLPIEKMDGQYRIRFEHDLRFDPEVLVTLIEGVMKRTEVSTDYFVEVEHCESKKIMYAYEIRTTGYADMIPCIGRMLPEDCYSLLITLLDDADIPLIGTTEKTYFFTSKKGKALVLMLGLLVAAFVGFFVRQKKRVAVDPDLILIGGSRFDKKNMALLVGDTSVVLSQKEADLLSTLNAAANAPVERAVLLQKVWGDEGDYVGRTLDVFVSKLRKKLEGDTSLKIVNVRGVGYKLVVG